MATQPVTLTNLLQYPGFGVGAMPKDAGEIDQEIVKKAGMALKNGWRHFDGAEIYCSSGELGIALSEVTATIPRDTVFITSKVHTSQGIAKHDIEGSLKAELKLLKTDYVDLFLIHNPFFPEGTNIEEIWKQMEDVQRQGLTKAIGISNFGPNEIKKVLSIAEIKPAVNQIEMHPYLYKEDQPTIQVCKENGILITSYAPLVAIGRHNGGPLVQLSEEIGKKYSVTSAQVLLRWQIEKDFVPITTSSNNERQTQQLQLYSFKLAPQDIEQIDEVGATYHFRCFGWGAGKKEYKGAFASKE